MKNAHLPLSQVAAGREQQLILQVDKCFISLVAFLYEQGGTLSVTVWGQISPPSLEGLVWKDG